MGVIQAAVLDVLANARAGLRPKEVQLGVQEHLGREVSYDTIGSFLSMASRDPGQAVVKTADGRYRHERA